MVTMSRLRLYDDGHPPTGGRPTTGGGTATLLRISVSMKTAALRAEGGWAGRRGLAHAAQETETCQKREKTPLLPLHHALLHALCHWASIPNPACGLGQGCPSAGGLGKIKNDYELYFDDAILSRNHFFRPPCLLLIVILAGGRRVIGIPPQSVS
jgi:hypothetical protein